MIIDLYALHHLAIFLSFSFYYLCGLPWYWHRGKLPFEIPNFAKFCHKQFKNLPHFAIKIDKFWKLSVLIGELFIVPGGPEYYIDKKRHTKSDSGAYQKEKRIKTSIWYQNKSTKTCKERHQNVFTRNIQLLVLIHKAFKIFFSEPPFPVWRYKIIDGEGPKPRNLSIAS